MFGSSWLQRFWASRRGPRLSPSLALCRLSCFPQIRSTLQICGSHLKKMVQTNPQRKPVRSLRTHRGVRQSRAHLNRQIRFLTHSYLDSGLFRLVPVWLVFRWPPHPKIALVLYIYALPPSSALRPPVQQSPVASGTVQVSSMPARGGSREGITA
jgi:hypothetical protein